MLTYFFEKSNFFNPSHSKFAAAIYLNKNINTYKQIFRFNCIVKMEKWVAWTKSRKCNTTVLFFEDLSTFNFGAFTKINIVVTKSVPNVQVNVWVSTPLAVPKKLQPKESDQYTGHCFRKHSVGWIWRWHVHSQAAREMEICKCSKRLRRLIDR